MNLRLRTSTAGNVHISHALICALVGLVGLAGMSAFGTSVERAILGDARGARAATAAAPVISQQAALSPGLVLRNLQPSELLLGGAMYSTDTALALRNAAHALSEAGRPPTALSHLRVGEGVAMVGAVPRLATDDMLAKLPRPRGFGVTAANDEAMQRMTFLLRLDEALTLAFARGHTGTYDARHVTLLGDETEMAESFRKSFRPTGVWSVMAHGSPTSFSRKVSGIHGLVEQPLTLDDFARVLYGRGYEDGQPILLGACSTGACTNVPANAAQQFAERFNAPVVAPSTKNWVGHQNGAMVAVSGEITPDQQLAGTVGEWRLFQPRSWITDHRVHDRVVMGRAPGKNEKVIAAVHELWRLPQAGARRVDITGHAAKFTGENSGAFAAAATALRSGGGLVVRTQGDANLAAISLSMQAAGLELLRAFPQDILTLVGWKP